MIKHILSGASKSIHFYTFTVLHIIHSKSCHFIVGKQSVNLIKKRVFKRISDREGVRSLTFTRSRNVFLFVTSGK